MFDQDVFTNVVGGVRVTDGAEGHVALDGGILGVGDLDPAEWDWQNPVLAVQVALSN